ncbi:uncharacterized protein [Ambystoma mexicanum]|uniref:uncharacterized protein n=1 Tax=Ambystoma mexicanum TaxID=8296 RepID=UPI0037E8919F
MHVEPSPMLSLSWSPTGSQSDSEVHDTTAQAPTLMKKARGMEGGNRPSTSRGTDKPGPSQRPKATHVDTSPRRERATDNVMAPTPASPITQEPVAEGSMSAANSLVGEAAATAPQSDAEEPCLTAVGQRTPSPQLSAHHNPRPTSSASGHELSDGGSLAGRWSPMDSSPDGGHMPQAAPRPTKGRD